MASVYTVVYVEDDADIVELVQMAFESAADIELLTCKPDSEVFERIRRARPSVVLLDVMMPGVDGRSIATAMRSDAELAGIPFVFMTAKARPKELAELYALGAVGVISKPFDVLKLPDEIRKLVVRAQA